MKIAIVGAGAIGSYYGARLAAAGNDVRFLLRSDFKYVRENGLKIESIHGDLELLDARVYNDSREIGVVDLVIVAWKTTSNHFASEVLTPLVGKNTKILTLQNGLGNVEVYGELFGLDRVLAGLCFICCNRIAPGRVRHSSSGLIRMARAEGGIDACLESLIEIFKSAGIRCDGMDDLEKALWMKLVWNFPFNGLAIAEGGVDTEVLLKEKKLEPLVRKLMLEIIATGKALGHDIPVSIVEQQMELTNGMGAYRPSSMIDFVSGMPVEFDSIWQKPVDVATHMGVPIEQMKKLLGRIQEALKKREVSME